MARYNPAMIDEATVPLHHCKRQAVGVHTVLAALHLHRSIDNAIGAFDIAHPNAVNQLLPN
jgi:hypothetical protein